MSTKLKSHHCLWGDSAGYLHSTRHDAGRNSEGGLANVTEVEIVIRSHADDLALLRLAKAIFACQQYCKTLEESQKRVEEYFAALDAVRPEFAKEIRETLKGVFTEPK